VPTYQYACTECGERTEVVQKFTDDALTVCATCGGKLRKVYSPVGIVFKGSGFYRTDSRSSSTAGDLAGSAANGSAKEGSAAKDGGSGGSGENGSKDTAKSSSSGSDSAASSASSSSSPGGKKSAAAASSSSSSGSKVA
jgi:putative FmdB family regulatory protein